MNKKVIFFFINLLLFVVVFYQNDIGINLGIFTVITTVLAYYGFSLQKITKDFRLAMLGSLLFSFTFTYYQDVASFLGLVFSLHWLAMLAFDPNQKLLKSLVLIPLNYLLILPNLAETKFNFSSKKTFKQFQLILALVLIPVGITLIFAIVYSMASSTLSAFFQNLNWHFEFSFLNMVLLIALGSILMYFFWFFRMPKDWKIVQIQLSDDFQSRKNLEDIHLNLMRKSGEITFILLNIILLIFIIIYGYENFFNTSDVTSISQNVHERVYAVIGSIILAVFLILLFFQGAINFIPKNNIIKNLSYIWLVLNVLLVSIAFVKNMHYVEMMGLTQKRMGVFAFLLLAFIGLIFTWIKIKNQKTNAFLINQMIRIFYYSMLILAFFNWSWIITQYNITADKIERDLEYHFDLPYNHVIMTNYFKTHHQKEFIHDNSIDKSVSIDGKLYDAWVNYRLKTSD
ncbi:MAG: DUF4173 domain-containing protein [Flavobacteriaceae bacterium]|nr:DUF4173 domain-containing protein [Flavobacteriaceae bacterium]